MLINEFSKSIILLRKSELCQKGIKPFYFSKEIVVTILFRFKNRFFIFMTTATVLRGQSRDEK